MPSAFEKNKKLKKTFENYQNDEKQMKLNKWAWGDVPGCVGRPKMH